MKKNASLLLVLLVSCLCAAAQTAKPRRAPLPPDLYKAAGRGSDSLLKDPAVTSRLKGLLGDKYDSFMESFETLNPVTRDGNYLFSSGCLIHACGHLESAIAVDLNRRTVHAAIFRQDEKTRYFNEGGSATPKAISNWADKLKQINGGKSGSDSANSNTNPTAAVTVAETKDSSPVRLRASVPVRGLIGGESHDAYVIHARKGRVLTVRLSWRREGDNRASFTVSGSIDFSGEPAKFGSESNGGRLWSGRVPKTGDYYIYVVAHPSAHYTLKVSDGTGK
jgi:hypothetical protein